jgi:hypothetical protein
MTDLISIAYLNESCFLSLNTDDKKYRMCLKMSQDHLKDELGVEFYEEIEGQYPTTLSADNSTLYENHIKDFLAWQTYFNYLKFSNVDATPTGIRVHKDENSDIASDIQMYSLEKNVKAQANFYKYQMINFLKESQANDSTKYPLWEDECKEQMSFAITSVDKNSDAMIRVNKAVTTNE